MAAAEARAVWQRTANRCFVQEDAKRAPKLACCQTSSTSKQVESGPSNIEGGPDQSAKGFMPLNRNSSYYNLFPDTRWWVQMQPSYVYQKGLMNEQLTEAYLIPEDFLETVGVKKGNHKLDMDPFDTKPVSKHPNDLDLDLDSWWTRSEKTEPWRRATDKDEIANLVAQKSCDHIENCDLPPPQKTCTRKYPYARIGCSERTRSLDMSSKFSSGQDCYDFVRTHSKQESVGKGNSSHCSEKSFSPEARQLPEADTSKAELMEALRHSQTRAREAEMAAKQASADKEHIIRLFFKQASHLFAYRQWFQLLQLEETIYIQIKNNDQPISSLIPVVFPWMSYKGRKMKKSLQRVSKRRRRVKRGRQRRDIRKYAVAFALGLSLVGAGLFLGWNVGWMFPPF